MNKEIPTAEEFLKSKGLFNDKSIRLQSNGLTSSEAMIEFAKLHVEAALKQASINATLLPYMDRPVVDKSSILQSYPLKNIK